MKVAVLLTGQLRTFEMVKYLHMNSLILKYNTDVFLGIDICNKYQTEHKNSTIRTNMQTVKDAIQFFKPVETFILEDFTDEFNKIQKDEKEFDLSNYRPMFQQYYVVKQTYKMLIDRINNGEKYDIIIRLRFDQFLFSDEVPIAPQLYDDILKKIAYNTNNTTILQNYTKDKTFIFEEIHDNTIYVFGFGDYKHYKYVNDQFFYHTQSILTQMFEFYDNILSLLKYCQQNEIGHVGATYECILYVYVKHSNNIQVKKSNIYGIFIREFD